MLFARVEKQGKYREGAWSLRNIAFDTDTRMLYCTDKLDNFRVLWKHKIRVTRIIAKASVTDFDHLLPDFDSRELFSFRIEGSYRPVGDGIPSQYEQPRGDEAEKTIILPHPSHPEDAKKKVEHDDGTGSTLVWYMRTSNQEDFMKIYTTIRDVLIRDELRPPQFWGLPKMDPRVSVPLAEPPLYLWHRFRSIKCAVFYACVHGHLALKSNDTAVPFTLHKEAMYLFLFDESVMIIRENGHVYTGIPLKDVEALHFCTTKKASGDAKNSEKETFISFISRKAEYENILFFPTLEPFAESVRELMPVAQVERVRFAVSHLQDLIHQENVKDGHADTPLISIKDARVLLNEQNVDETKKAHGLSGIYAHLMAKSCEKGFRLTEECVEGDNESKERSQRLIHQLPSPQHLKTLALSLDICVKKAHTNFPSCEEYMSHSATVDDPAGHPKKGNPLLEIFFFSGIY